MSAGQIIPSVTSVQIHFFQWMRYSSDWLRFNNSVINTQERTEFRSWSLSLWNSNRENAVRTIWNTKTRSPLFRNLPLHICINFITQTKDIKQKKYSKVVIQHIQLPCGEEESQKHEAHLKRKYWKEKQAKIRLQLQLLCTCLLSSYYKWETKLDQVYPEKSTERQPLKTASKNNMDYYIQGS